MKKTYLLTLLAGLLFIVNSTSAESWPQIQKLLASDGVAWDYFGNSVSIDGDYAVVGTSSRSGFTGAAYVFYRSGTTWTLQAELIASDSAAGDGLGQSVSICGNYVIVGASANNSKGAAYIFYRNGTTWTQQAKLVASDGAASDGFGCSVTISGDYAIVGAVGDDDKGSNSGSAYIFCRSGTAWTQQAKLAASDGTATDEFGRSVSISGAYAIVGAHYDDDKGTDSGSAYIFYRSGTTWTQQVKLLASDGTANDEFGRSVSIDGDYAIVGASGDGSAYVFCRSGTTWNRQAKLVASGGYFGNSVFISGDYAIVGAYWENSRGSAYLFERNGTAWTQLARLVASDRASGDLFGQSVAIDGDYAVVGAYQDDDNGTNSGSAYIFEYCPADMNDDLQVNLADLMIFTGYLYGSSSEADLDGDGRVNLADFAIIAQWWLYGTEE